MSKTRARSYGARSNNPFSASTFKIPGLSMFDWSHTTSWSQDFGDLRPVDFYDLIVGTRMRCNLSYVLNMDPLRKPLYAGINVTYDAVYVSDNLLGYDSEEFFNVNMQVGVADKTVVKQPRINAGLLLYTYYAASKRKRISGGAGDYVPFGPNWPIPRPIYNTLYDAFGYPFNSHYYDILGNIRLYYLNTPTPQVHYLSDFIDPSFIPSEDWSSGPWLKNGSEIAGKSEDDIIGGFYISYPEVDSTQNSKLASAASLLNCNTLQNSSSSVNGTCYYQASTSQVAANGVTFMSCLRYLLRFLMCLPTTLQNPEADFESESAFLSWCQTHSLCLNNDSTVLELSDVDWDLVCRFAGFASYSEFLDVYKSYLYSKFYAGVALNVLCDFRPILAYRRAYNDLYVNTNLWDCDNFAARAIDDYYEKIGGELSTPNANIANLLSNAGNNVFVAYYDNVNHDNDQFEFAELFNLGFYKRWFSNDMFTSAVPADLSSAANAVEIPSSGLTLIDLRNLNIDQEVKDRTSYAGLRTPDNIVAFFGFQSPELRYRYARHIARMQDTPRIDNVLQNSAGTTDSPLGTPAGYGYGSKTGKFFDYQMPWYGFILILSSVMTEPVYRDAVDRMILEKDYEDFLFWPYQEISDVPVMNIEIQPTGASEDHDGFGYQRSYYYYMRKNNTLRGTMRLSEKIDWNLSRDMRDGFALNSDFATPNSSDRFNRIFADTSDGINHFNFFMGLDVQVTEPLKRDIHYHL